MSISVKTHKMLWGRSGNRCAYPGCKLELVFDETETDDASVIGEEAHIVAKSPEGPRGENELPLEKRDKYGNLILLCSVHHKLVDDQVKEYSVQKLKVFKQDHERWVKDNLGQDSKRIRDDELYAAYIENFIQLTDLHNWNNWTSWMFGSSEYFPKQIFESLGEVPNYIISRIWPQRYPKLESAFFNFKAVLNDLRKVYFKYPEYRDDGPYRIDRIYRNQYQDKKREEILYKKYMFHVALIEDLLLELTRSANFLCDFIREYIFQGFRLEEGAILITRGDILSYQTFRVEYRRDERTEIPYPGLRDFMEIRNTRDICIGEGIEEDYLTSIRDELFP